MDVTRFVRAQEDGDTYATALSELRSGRKRTHWMWFVFPQVEGLGRSAMAQRYALSGREEARAYAEHPVLGPRLRATTQALLDLPDGTDPERVLGGIDAVKLRSSLTLFADLVPECAALLERWYDGPDEQTLQRL